MRIGLDIDGVLADFTGSYIGLMNELSHKKIDPGYPSKWLPPIWDFEPSIGFTKEDVIAAWVAIKSSTSFWEDLDCLPGAFATLDIDLDHDVYYITARPGINVKSQTEGWLATNLQVPNPTVLVSDNKGPLAVGLGLDVLIDDRDKNIIEVAAASPRTQCYILDYPYNSHVQETSNIHRIYSVKQALQESGILDHNYN